MAFLSPFAETARGFKAYLKGLAWLKEHPRYFVLLLLPIFVALALFVSGVGALMSYGDQLMAWALFTKPEAWYWLIFYYLAAALLYVGVIVVVLLAAMLMMNIVAAPIYEVVSVAIERDFTGEEPPPLGFIGNVRVIWDEVKKAVLILGLSVAVLFVPGINVLSSLIVAFLIGWSFYDFPLARRGWGLGDRIRFVSGQFFSVMGFGIWLVIPFLQFAFMPLAVAGGTLLNLEALQERRMLSTYSLRRSTTIQEDV